LLGQADATRLANPFQPRSDVHAVTHEVAVALLDDVTKVDANAKLDALVGRDLGVALDHGPLDFDGAVHGVDDTAELDGAPSSFFLRRGFSSSGF
jgi:hypothetical protein